MNTNVVSISKSVSSAVAPSERVLQTAAMFGLGVDESRDIAIVPPCDIPLPHLNHTCGIVFITGPSGSGKSTILRLIGDACRNHSARIVDFNDLPPLPDLPLVDVFDASRTSLQQVMEVFSIVGLSDAFVMLRTPCELSDGQRYRLRLAHALMLTLTETDCDFVILADEFASTLDRITAQTIARNLRRWMNRLRRNRTIAMSFIAATAHDDILESLEPDVLVWKGLGDAVEVATR